ncbi:MAG TPA: hypothetical protein VF768_12410 [Holophagaceae bacterium]
MTNGMRGVAALSLLLGGLACQPPRPALPEPPAVQLSIRPEAVTVTAGHAFQFGHRVASTGSLAVTWRVVEPGGGSLDATGRYQAPDHPGTWTVEVRSLADPRQAAQARVTVVPPPRGPISAPLAVAPGAADLRASVPVQPGCGYAWSLEGGTLAGAADGPEVAFQAGQGPDLKLRCRVTNAAGDVLTASLDLPVAPVVPLAIAPAQATLTVGHSMTFGYTHAGTERLVWRVPDSDGGSVDAKGTYRAPAAPGLYTLQVAPSGHPDEASRARVKVVPAPVAPITGPAALAAGQAGLTARVPIQPGATYAWEIQGGSLTEGAWGPVVTFTAGAGPTLTLRCTVTNEAGDAFTGVLVLPVGR